MELREPQPVHWPERVWIAPTRFPSAGTMEFPAHFRASVIGHFYSALPSTLTLAPTGAPGGIFVTAVNGDGTGDGYATNGTNGTLGRHSSGTRTWVRTDAASTAATSTT